MTNHHAHPAGKLRSLASIVVLLVSLLALSSCASTGMGGASGSAEKRAERMAQNGQHNEAAGAYMGLAANAVGVDRDRLTLLAIEQRLDAGDVAQARRGMASMRQPTSGPLLPLWNTNTGRFVSVSGRC